MKLKCVGVRLAEARERLARHTSPMPKLQKKKMCERKTFMHSFFAAGRYRTKTTAETNGGNKVEENSTTQNNSIKAKNKSQNSQAQSPLARTFFSRENIAKL